MPIEKRSEVPVIERVYREKTRPLVGPGKAQATPRQMRESPRRVQPQGGSGHGR